MLSIEPAAACSFQWNTDGVTGNASQLLTQNHLEKLGVTGVSGAAQVALINAALDTAAPGAIQTVKNIQDIASAANAVIALANGVSGDGTALVRSQLTTLGVTGVDSALKLGLFNSALDTKATADADATSELQALSDNVARVVQLADGIVGNPTTAMSAQQFTNIGVTGMDANSASLLTSFLDGAMPVGVNTVAKLQNFANAAQAVTRLADGQVSQNVPGVTLQQLATLGVNITGNDALLKLALLNTALDAAQPSAVANLAGLQSLTNVASLVLGLADGIALNAANPMTAQQFATLGVTGLDATSAAILGSAIDAAVPADVGTLASIQAKANVASLIAGSANASAGNDAGLTLTQVQTLGLQGVSATGAKSFTGS